jgi:hypothetical protein
MRTATERQRIHTVAFDDPDAALTAVRTFRSSGFEVSDVHTPFAVHGMDEALGLPPTRLPRATLVGGLLGCVAGMGFQLWVHAMDWPLNIGGKTNMAWQALVPVGFEVTILVAALATVAALLLRGRLFVRLSSGTPASQPDVRVTDDRFVLLVVENDGSFSPERFRAQCARLGAVEVVEGWSVS